MNVCESLKKYNITINATNKEGKNVIFTDCMDTVIRRNTSIWGVIDKWSKKMSHKFNVNRETLKIYRYETIRSGMHNTVSIEVIYQEMYDQLHFYGLVSNISKDLFVKKAHEIELDIEKKSHSAIKQTIDFLTKEKEKGRTIYCLSDFRLPSNDLKIFFKNLNIAEIFDDCFSSCDFGETKKSGELYKIILQKIKANPDDCLMIGDNLKSDCINASLYGIKSCLIV